MFSAIELKLRRFRKPTFIGLKSGASCKYLMSISQTSIYQLGLAVTTILSKPSMLFHVCEGDFDAYDVSLHRTGIAEVTGSNPVEACLIFQASSFQLLKLENLLR